MRPVRMSPEPAVAMAGVPVPSVMQGRSLVPMLTGQTPKDWRTEFFYEHHSVAARIPQSEGVRTERWKYIRNYFPAIPYMQHNAYKEKEYPTWNLVKQLSREGKLTPEAALFAAERKPVEELFDLASDPHEVRNLAADAAHAATLRELRALVDGWVVESRDQGDRLEDPLDVFRGYNGRLPDEAEKAKKN